MGGNHHSRVPSTLYPSQYSSSHAKKSGIHQNAPHATSSSGRMRPSSPPLMRESLKHREEKLVRVMFINAS